MRFIDSTIAVAISMVLISPVECSLYRYSTTAVCTGQETCPEKRGAALWQGPPRALEYRGSEPRQRRHELAGVDGAPTAGQVVPRHRRVTRHARERVVTGGDVHDAGVLREERNP